MKLLSVKGKRFLAALILVATAVAAAAMGTQKVLAVQTLAAKRALPIYNVKTDEKKVAISFDAAWGNVILVNYSEDQSPRWSATERKQP